MKLAIVVLSGTLALTGCATMQRDQNGSGSELFSSSSREQQIRGGDSSTLQRSKGETSSRESSHTSTPEVKSKRIPRAVLSKDTLREILTKIKGNNDEFKDIPIEKLAFIAIFDRTGNISAIATHRGTHSNRTDTISNVINFPIPTQKGVILAQKLFAITTYKGSHYQLVYSTSNDNGVLTEHVEKVYLDPPHPCPPDYYEWRDDC